MGDHVGIPGVVLFFFPPSNPILPSIYHCLPPFIYSLPSSHFELLGFILCSLYTTSKTGTKYFFGSRNFPPHPVTTFRPGMSFFFSPHEPYSTYCKIQAEYCRRSCCLRPPCNCFFVHLYSSKYVLCIKNLPNLPKV